MKTWALDFETYYINERGGEKYSLSLKGKDRLSTVDYVTDPRWHVHGLAVLDPNGDAHFVPHEEVKDVLACIDKDDLVLAHNWAFDGLAFHYHYDWRHWNVVDTLLLANVVLGTRKDRGLSNSLGDLAEELQLPHKKGDLSPIEGVRNLDPDQLAYLALYAKGDVRITLEVYNKLISQLCNAESEIWLMQHTLNMFINRAVAVSREKVEKATADLLEWNQRALDRVMSPDSIHRGHGDSEQIEPLVTDVMQLSSEKQFSELLEPILKKNGLKLPRKRTEQKKRPPTKPKRKRPSVYFDDKEGKTLTLKQMETVQQWAQYDHDIATFEPGTIKTMIPALAKADFGFQKLLVCGVPVVEDLCSARIALKSGRTVAARLKGIQADVAHMSLIYHGTGPGRWAGGGNGWNPQNIPSPSRATDEEQARMSVALRSCLVPIPGHSFVHIDLAQAEARVVAWEAGQWDLVQQFADGEDVYCSFISDALGQIVVKPDDGDKSEAAREMRALRAVGKESVLGLGFGMGDYKFHARLRAIPAVRNFLGARLTDKFAANLKNAYREMYKFIPLFWKNMDTSFHMARRGANAQLGVIRFEPRVQGESVWMYYPNGRRIPYTNLREHQNLHGDSDWLVGSGKKIYGGLLTENAVQGTARDILAEGMYACETQGYRVMLTVHDSIILEVPTDKAQEALDFIIKTFRTPPTWAPKLALDAEGHISEDFH